MRERLVLRILVGQMIRALKLDANGEIIAHGPALILGFTGMPGARLKGHVLHDAAIALDERMRRDALPRDVTKKGMRIRIQSAGKKPIDPSSAELARRQTDAMNDNEVRQSVLRTHIEIRRQHLSCPREQPRGQLNLHAPIMPQYERISREIAS